MSKPRRLFDCLEEQLNMGSVETALAAKEDGKWRRYSTKEIIDIVDKLAAGLLALGISGNDMSIEGRDKIAILSKNRPEWIFLDLAVQKTGAILVPIYPTVHISDLEFALNDAQVKMVFVNDADMHQKVQNVLIKTPSVRGVYSFEKLNEVKHWKDILSEGKHEHFKHLTSISERINTEDLFTIIYTSGTTGTPKGVMLSHHNVLSNVMSTLPHFNLSKKTRVISFLPLNHIFERMVTYLFLFSGANIYYPENLDNLGDALKDVKPHMFTTVPRLLEKVYERIMSKAEALTGVKKKLFFWALSLANQYDIKKPGSYSYRLQLRLANKIVFSKWREALGNEVQFIVTGAAACPVKMIRIFTAAGVPILEGYGQTETSPVISVNGLKPEQRMFGTVGPVIDGVQVKIAEDGEILCKGPNVMMGYYKRPDLTEEAIKDGWLHTGDIGTLVDNFFLKITDRKKEIFKTSGGKYIAPQPIENKMVEDPLIDQIMVVGANKKFAGALIVPAFHVMKNWCKSNGIDAHNNEDMIVHPAVKQRFKEIVDELNKNFSQVEQIKKFELLPYTWSIEGGELTPNLKLRRKVIMEKYHLIIERIYQ
ncbi:long-chain fatty acid--CoA ligase [Chitinophagaceae bacterium LB-8]|uniref:Long-chain fatty acid--CoA ligase n=1 Tax=Paraflavisolibacter caeni TaxID=2982496 RepID=A0A9X2XRS1_9BACT|nr:long-chain fatty acid--CoA ligase [Paraflavisolibacter caeni]MCU7547624.1 long-chain fatty acid--CoA ligase [Paraflavisolibacter caeni]